MKVLMVDLTIKDDLSSVFLMHPGFGAPSVDDHYDLIGSLSLLYVDVCCDYGNVGGMGGIHRLDDYDIGDYLFQMVICYFLPDNSSKAMSYFFPVFFLY